jgi:hypothetical protein
VIAELARRFLNRCSHISQTISVASGAINVRGDQGMPGAAGADSLRGSPKRAMMLGLIPLLAARHEGCRVGHLVVGLEQKVIEVVDANESVPRKFHVRDDI